MNKKIETNGYVETPWDARSIPGVAGGTRVEFALYLKGNRQLTAAEKKGIPDILKRVYSNGLVCEYDLGRVMRIDAINPGKFAKSVTLDQPVSVMEAWLEHKGRKYCNPKYMARMEFRNIREHEFECDEDKQIHVANGLRKIPTFYGPHIILADEQFPVLAINAFAAKEYCICRPLYIGKKFVRWVQTAV